MPPVLAGWHLVARLFEVGPTGGDGPVTFQELQAWSAMTGCSLSAWEAQTLRILSSRFMAMSHKAIEPACPPPYAPARPLTRPQVADKLSAMFAKLERQHAQDARKRRPNPQTS
jgi:hypothetical protein